MGKCYNKIEIAAPIEPVWQALSNFHDMSFAPEVITSVTKVGDKGGREVGAKRILNQVFHETLLSLNDRAHCLSYSIDDGPGPVARDAVSNYVGEIKLTQSAAGTLVEWSSHFEADKEDEVADFCNPIYAALLAGLKKSLS